MKNLVETLTALHGPCGYEQPVIRWIRDNVKSLVDEIKIDSLGNVIAIKKGRQPGPSMVMTAHMDEVGFIVKKIESNGLIRFEKLGGHDDRILLTQKVQIRTKKGLLTGVIGSIPAHYAKFDDANKVRNHRQMYIDIGIKSKQEAIDMGVELGSPITWAPNMDFLGNETTGRFVGKGFDDRAGCAVLIKTLQELENTSFSGTLTAIFTVQEEVGLRGAQVAAKQTEADVAVAIDATAVSDTPEEMMDNTLSIGGGTGIKVLDFSLISHPAVKDHLIALAVKNKITYQMEIFPGIGTDGGAMSLANRGIPTGVLSIPSRYAHSPLEIIDMNDLIATKNLLKAFILSLKEDTTFSFLEPY
ncbi:M42 family metallopeptidase [Salipaludibacillus daqingensis]|uniref:M42 family metallopeptidase n=1 Tax=Salipaludibacillus daqingensis TaxID=3041001 RepID=UPI002473A0DF|nr:M42 family metallopeptidase [Salipaludibacillus daqingensis]